MASLNSSNFEQGLIVDTACSAYENDLSITVEVLISVARLRADRVWKFVLTWI